MAAQKSRRALQVAGGSQNDLSHGAWDKETSKSNYGSPELHPFLVACAKDGSKESPLSNSEGGKVNYIGDPEGDRLLFEDELRRSALWHESRRKALERRASPPSQALLPVKGLLERMWPITQGRYVVGKALDLEDPNEGLVLL